MRSGARLAASLSIGLALICGAGSAQEPPAPAAEVSAKTWLTNRAQIEEALKTAEVDGLEELQIGVTKPRRAKLAPGGPVDAFAW